MKLKVYYRALTELHTNEDRWLYTAYTLLKAQCDDFTRKPGFLSVRELKPLSVRLNVNVSTLYKRLKRLTDNGYILKNKYGYTLTNVDAVLSNHLNFTKSPRKKNNQKSMYHPYTAIDIPDTNDLYTVDLMMLYALTKQVANRKNDKTNGLYVPTRKRKQNAPDRIKVALEYLRKSGKYNSKMTVRKMMTDLESLKLVKIKKGQMNDELGVYETNEYAINHLSKVSWSGLAITHKTTDVIDNQGKEIKKKKKIKFLKPHEIKFKVTTNPIEQKFIDYVYNHRSIFVAMKFVPYAFHNQKIRRTMIPNILNRMLACDDMKNILLSQFKPENIMIEKTRKSLYDPSAYVYARQYDYSIDYPTLVEAHGNFNQNTAIYSFHDSMLKAKESRSKGIGRYDGGGTI